MHCSENSCLSLWLSLLVVFTHFTAVQNVLFRWYSDDPDIDRNATEIISSRGFIPEAHSVVTKDGYILTVFRILNPFVVRAGKRMRPVYIQHGLFGNSDDFLLNSPGSLREDGLYQEDNGPPTDCASFNPDSVSRTLSFVLAACGYDVWLGNSRGNRYSSGHVLLDSGTDSRFWSFDVDHLSAYDVTAVIHHILNVTNSDSLGYIGHSLGTSVMFQLLSNQPEYTPLVRPFIALAPVAYVGTIESPLLRFGALFEPLLEAADKPFFGIPSSSLAVIDRYFAHFFCGNSFLDEICELFIFILCGFDYPNTNTTRIPSVIGHFPDGTSLRVLGHLAQRVNRKSFAFYDYGSSKNTRVYGEAVPPNYNLSAIVSKDIVLISGVNDWLADPTDVDILRSQLTVPIYEDYVVPYELWNHADYLIGINAGKYQNAKILKLLQQFNN